MIEGWPEAINLRLLWSQVRLGFASCWVSRANDEAHGEPTPEKNFLLQRGSGFVAVVWNPQ